MEISLDVDEREGCSVVGVSGEVDMATVPRVREELHRLLAQGFDHIVIDLDGVTFLDSTGLGVLVGALKRVRAVDGDLHLVCNPGRVRKVFSVTGLDKVFSMYESLDEAVAGAGATPQLGA